MKTIIRKSFMALGASAVMLTGCDVNSWNDGLDGFEVPAPGVDVESITYALTQADYAAIAKNSTNKSLAEAAGEQEALAAIAENCAFASDEQARRYIPAFLGSTSFRYFTLDNGSSVKVTYNMTGAEAEAVRAINAGALAYEVSENDYQSAWDSDDNFINAFAPMTPAEASVPGFLRAAFPDAVSGTYAGVSYNWSAQNPVFGNVGSGDQNKMSNVLGAVSLDQQLSIRGVVTAICTRGFIVTDKGGSILVYGADFDETSLSLYSEVSVSGPVSSYGTAFQIALGSAVIEVLGEGAYEFPEPVSMTPEAVMGVCSRTDDATAFYAEADVTLGVSGNYYNLYVDGLDGYDLSAYYTPDFFKDMMEDGGRYHVTGYVIGKSGTSHCNIILTSVSSVSQSMRAPAAQPVTEGRVGLYRFNGSAWTVASNVVMLQPSDYTAMAQKFANLTGDGPETLLPEYLGMKYPFAADGDELIVCYNYYDSATKASAYRARHFVLVEGRWTRNAGEVTEQFSRADGKWAYNPSVVLNLPADRSAFGAAFYQDCVDWVFETKCVPLGDDNIKSGKFWVTSYGNNEYWSGTSAYQTNVDIRPAAARNQYAAGFEGMDDKQIQDFLMTNLLDGTFPAVLAKYYPDLRPVDGMDVTLTVNFVTYDGAKADQQVVYRVLGVGEYERISTSWEF